MKLFVGLDVSLAKTAVCALTEHGKIVMEVDVASEPEPLIRNLQSLEGTLEAIGLEAGPMSQWLHRAMTEAGLPAALMETRQVKGALKAMPIKTDRRHHQGRRCDLRRALCQAATVMLNRGRSNDLRTWASRIARRCGRKRAMVALARRMAVVLHRIWVDGTTFRMEGAPTT